MAHFLLKYVADMEDLPSQKDFLWLDNNISYVTELSEVLSKIYVWYSISLFVHLLIVIPGNILTIFVIAKTKTLWTYSNIVISINGFFMVIGSVFGLFFRQSSYPLLLFDETQRVTAYSIAWWITCLTFRIGNNR